MDSREPYEVHQSWIPSLIPGMNKALQLDMMGLTSQKQFCNEGSGASGQEAAMPPGDKVAPCLQKGVIPCCLLPQKYLCIYSYMAVAECRAPFAWGRPRSTDGEYDILCLYCNRNLQVKFHHSHHVGRKGSSDHQLGHEAQALLDARSMIAGGLGLWSVLLWVLLFLITSTATFPEFSQNFSCSSFYLLVRLIIIVGTVVMG